MNLLEFDSKLVFLNSQSVDAEPYTTPDIIANFADTDLHSVNRLIRKYQDDLKEFGILGFEIRKLKAVGRPKKVWHLNEGQSMLLLQYLANAEPVRKFKKALTHAFIKERKELIERQAVYEFGKDFSKDLGDAIKNNPYSDVHSYPNYNRLIYKQALGISSNRIKQLRRIPDHQPITKYLNTAESKAVQKVKNQVIALLDMKLNYQQIKDTLGNQGIIYQITLPTPTAVK
ncbi:hypothetical protein YK48G_17330 [Lentilactobacillus fungorum]|uniref:Phage regulatory protein Rha (Phage_pRha) n=1 Tax=Lentilactobacillus fungorum TaxID=2201250 RepID=A0ABQ3VZX5_9LACO|nr:Rha family transcriptional regulator [Lentilactobacillus fungorum]GHP14308.1 hypothetical protein YK48G_17330 [Lentilactobacillus fungorum]